MEDIIVCLADLLYKKQPYYQKIGYTMSTKEDWLKVAQDWVEVHSDWSIDELFLGIKYYNYCFPEHVDIEMINIAQFWENEQKNYVKKFDK